MNTKAASPSVLRWVWGIVFALVWLSSLSPPALPSAGLDASWGIAWVVGHRLDERAKVSKNTRRVVRLRFQRPNA